MTLPALPAYKIVWEEPGEGWIASNLDTTFPRLRFSLDDADPGLARKQGDQIKRLVQRLNEAAPVKTPSAPGEGGKPRYSVVWDGPSEGVVMDQRTLNDVLTFTPGDDLDPAVAAGINAGVKYLAHCLNAQEKPVEEPEAVPDTDHANLDRLLLARKRIPCIQARTAGTGLSSLLVNVLDELELHCDALKRAGLLKP